MADPMMDLFGVPLALDIGTALGLLVGGGIGTGVVANFRRKSEESRRASEEAAREEQAQKERAKREATERYRAHREALEIHESVSSLDVFEALERASDPAAKSFLIAAHLRGQSRYLAFNDSKSDGLATELEKLVTHALDRIATEFPDELGKAQAQVTEKQKRRSNDRSRYFVGDSGPFSKHHTLHVIAHRFCERNKITKKDDFIEMFGKIVRTEIGESVDEVKFLGPSLLLDPTTATEAHQKRYGSRDQQTMRELGSLRLDGVDHLLGVEVGYEKAVADRGRRVHRPLIEHFRTLEGYQDIRLDESSV